MAVRVYVILLMVSFVILGMVGGTNMLVTNILLGIIIVVLFAILDRLGDMYYSDEPEHIQMTKEELKAWLKDKED